MNADARGPGSGMPAVDPTELQRVRERAAERGAPAWMRLEALYALQAGVSAPIAIVMLLVTNAIPVVGVLFFGWDLFAILILYWIESGIVGGLNIAKIALARGSRMPANVTVRGGDVSTLAGMKAFAIPFFVMHYGIFWAVHGLFVVLFLPLITGSIAGAGAVDRFGVGLPFGVASPLDPFRSLPLVALGAVGLTASHVVSFLVNYVGGREYERTNPISQMMAPYGRVFVLHFTIVFGAALISLVGSPIALLLILVGVKTLIDLGLHLREHLRLSGGRTTLEGPLGRVSVG